MNYRICEAEQGTPEWLADRAGCATGSKAKLIPEAKSDKKNRPNELHLRTGRAARNRADPRTRVYI